MPTLSTKPNRFYPSIPTVSGDVQSHQNALQIITESIETHERRNNNYLKSFIRFEELVTLGIIDESGEFIFDATAGGVEEAPTDGQQYGRQNSGWTVITGGTSDHLLLSNIGVNTHAQIDSHIADSTIHFSAASLDATFLRLDTTNDPLTGSLQIDSNLFDLNNSAVSTASTIINRNSAGGVTLNVNATTGNAQIGQTTGAGAADGVFINLIRDGGVQLRWDDTIKAETTTDGFLVTGTLIDLDNSAAATNTGPTARNSAGGARFLVNSLGRLVLQQTSSAGAGEKVWAVFERDAYADLRYNSTTKLLTALNGVEIPDGDIFFDNTYAINWENASATPIELLDFDAGTAGDASWSQVQLLAEFEGTDGATTYTEVSQNGLTATFVNQAQIDTADFNFGASSALFDGTGDQVTFPNDAALQFGSGDWTVEFFFEMDTLLSNPETKYIAGHHGTAGNQPWAFLLQADGFSTQRMRVYIEGAPEVTTISGTTLAVNTFYHVCIERTGSNYYVGFNGTRIFQNVGVLSGAMETSDVPLMIGTNPNITYDSDLDGHVDDMRITIGSNRYNLSSNSTYTVPTSYPIGGGTAETFHVGDPGYPTNIEGSEVQINGVPHDTHTGEVTGGTALTVQVSSITNRQALPSLAETADEVALHDQTDGSLRKAPVDSITDGGFF